LLPLGQYKLTVSLSGFTLRQEGIVLVVGQTANCRSC
jgi:hypothetical protein